MEAIPAEVSAASPWPAELPSAAESGFRGVSRRTPSRRPVAHHAAADRDPRGCRAAVSRHLAPSVRPTAGTARSAGFFHGLSSGTGRTLRRLDGARPLRLAGDRLQLCGELDSPVHGLPGRPDLAEPGQRSAAGLAPERRRRPRRGVSIGQRNTTGSGQCGTGYLAGELLPHRGHAPDAVPAAQ